MAAGRPLLYIGPKAGTPATYINQFQCGWRIEPGDADALISLLEKLADNRQSVREPGRRAREIFEQYFDRAIGVARISAAIHSGFASAHAGISDAKPATSQITLKNEPRQQLTL
jgi:glycosyltransferase involved in cell wall biosynthesis